MQRISAELEKMSEGQIQKLYDEQNALNEWQMSEDTPETLASMPTLTLADIDTKPENIPSEISNAGNICVLRHPIGRNGVCYVSMYFDINGLTEEEHSQAALLCEVLGKLDTAQYSAEQLTKVKNLKEQITAIELGQGVAAFNRFHQTCNHPGLTHISLPELPAVEFSFVWMKASDNHALPFLVSQMQQYFHKET